jgi:hypothetical protein
MIADMRRNEVLAGAAILAAIVAAVLLVHGTDADGMGAAIRATARTSALCAGLAFARIRVRELSALLPVSHALHYALIIAAGERVTGWPELVVGGAAFAVMLWNAMRPNAAALYILWIVFIVAFLRPGALYVMIIALLLGVEWLAGFRAPVKQSPEWRRRRSSTPAPNAARRLRSGWAAVPIATRGTPTRRTRHPPRQLPERR